ncbi:MAG TPA: hypothetical protein VJW73_12200 [Gemmatimonadaceae bacterium]|nr:hypothetical protein [Gemmatimonadaceae bacterium]
MDPLIVESDDWRAGPNLATADVQERVAAALEFGVLIVEHWHYRGARAPTRLFIEDVEDWTAFLRDVVPGDNVYVWEFGRLCAHDNALVAAKAPDARGRTPRGGAY